MNHIFHYHVTGFLALRAGFSGEDAHVLATSAQYVDHALIPITVLAKGFASPYTTPVTHHFGFWDAEQELAVWIPYHFFPSGAHDTKRRDGRVSPWCVRPRSAPVKELLIAAFKTRDLYRMGIALHVFADSWAHQEFIGKRDDFNRLPGVVGIPPLGHAQAESLPDLWQVEWRDDRLVEAEISNHRRFLDAARSMYKYLAAFQHRDATDCEQVMTELELLIGFRGLPQPYRTGSSNVQEGVRKGLNHLSKLVRTLGNEADPTQEAMQGDQRDPRFVGDDDALLAMRLSEVTGLPGYGRLAWRQEALLLDGNHYLDDEAAGINDKLSWIRHEIISRVGYAETRLTAQAGFGDSHLFRWSEAARAHATEAARILRQF